MAAAGPTHRGSVGRWSPQPRRLRAPAGIRAPQPSLHPVIALLSPGGALTQTCLWFQRKRKGMGRGIKRKLFLISFPNMLQNKAGLMFSWWDTDAAGRPGSVLTGP